LPVRAMYRSPCARVGKAETFRNFFRNVLLSVWLSVRFFVFSQWRFLIFPGNFDGFGRLFGWSAEEDRVLNVQNTRRRLLYAPLFRQRNKALLNRLLDLIFFLIVSPSTSAMIALALSTRVFV
jgi:hypothetical protein